MGAPIDVDDLAPGDAGARDLDWSGLHLERIADPRSPLFARAYGRLWREFGERGELEREEVLASRLAWRPELAIGEHALLYEMVAIEWAGEIVALRDHTAIVDAAGDAFVHLSHVLVEPPWRGGGLAGWLRALPLATARRCGLEAHRPLRSVTLVAEMERPTDEAASIRRLRSYERAGYLKIDPARVSYAQPDFRSAAEIDATGVRPVPLTLVVRRVGRESEKRIDGGEIRRLVGALYAMFAVHVRAADMAPLRQLMEHLPEEGEAVPLVPPTA